MSYFIKHMLLTAVILGLVATGLSAAVAQAERMACCDPAVRAMMNVPVSVQESDQASGTVNGTVNGIVAEMPCHEEQKGHKEQKSCEGCCKQVPVQPSIAAGQWDAAFLSLPVSSVKAGKNRFFQSLVPAAIPHPPKA